MKKLAVCFNPKSGQTDVLAQLKAAFAGYRVEVQWIKLNRQFDSHIAHAIKQGVEILVAAGGDGTVNAVATIARRHKLPLAIVPAGTLNHFAKDLNLPLQLEQAVAVACQGKTIRVDVGQVNDTIFLNNSSIGVYPALVQEREKHQALVGKWPAAFVALAKLATKIKKYRVTMHLDEQVFTNKTPFIFVGNNSYRLHKIGFTNRSNLQAGNLSVYWITTAHFWHIIRIFLRALLGRTKKDHDFEARLATKVTLALPYKKILVAYDGEVTSMTTPLHYEILPKALQVIVQR